MVSLQVLKGKYYSGHVLKLLYFAVTDSKPKKPQPNKEKKHERGGEKESLIFEKRCHVFPALISNPFPPQAKRNLPSLS